MSGVAGERFLAAHVVDDLMMPAPCIGCRARDPLFLFIQPGAGDGQALQLRGGRYLGLAQRREG